MDDRNEKGEEKTGTSVLVYPLLKAIKSYRILLAFIWRCKIAPSKKRWTEKQILSHEGTSSTAFTGDRTGKIVLFSELQTDLFYKQSRNAVCY